ETFKRYAGTLGELGVALLHFAVLGDTLGLVAVNNDEEGVASVRHGFEAEDFDGSGGTGDLEGAAAVVEHGANLAEGVADDIAVVEVEGSILNEDSGDGAAPAVELGFKDRADGFAPGSGFGRLDVGDQADHFEEQVEVDALLGGDFDEDGAF